MKTAIPPTFSSTIPSPLGEIILTATDTGLNGLFFPDQQHFPQKLQAQWQEKPTHPHLQTAQKALDAYFAKNTKPLPPIDFSWGTVFQREVWQQLQTIPLGKTATYGAIAANLGKPQANRAVGAAVGRNPISILIPCHRVIGSSGSLTGYAGGLERKTWLLEFEAGQFT